MNETYVVEMDNDQIRFTPDGRVFVLDAIKAVSGSNSEQDIWKNMKLDHPDILKYCERPAPSEDDGYLVVNTEGWDKIWMLLPQYLFLMDG